MTFNKFCKESWHCFLTGAHIMALCGSLIFMYTLCSAHRMEVERSVRAEIVMGMTQEKVMNVAVEVAKALEKFQEYCEKEPVVEYKSDKIVPLYPRPQAMANEEYTLTRCGVNLCDDNVFPSIQFRDFTVKGFDPEATVTLRTVKGLFYLIETAHDEHVIDTEFYNHAKFLLTTLAKQEIENLMWQVGYKGTLAAVAGEEIAGDPILSQK